MMKTLMKINTVILPCLLLAACGGADEPAADTSVALEDTYLPVWVTGEISVEQVDTKLAKAGYQIKNAKVELYSAPIK